MYHGKSGKVFVVIGIFAVLFILFYAISFYLQSRASNDSKVVEVAPSLKEKEGVLSIFFLSIEEETVDYEVKVRYPKINSTTVRQDEANKSIEKYFNNKVASFINNTLSRMSTDAADHPNDLPKNSYIAETEKVFENEDFISFFTEEFFYYRGTAHPSHMSVTFVYGKKDDKIFTLSDVFVTSDAFYKTLTPLVTQKLTKSLEEIMEKKLDKSSLEWVQEGLSNKEESFEKFTLSDTGVVFYFDEYEVASYVFGPQQVFVSYEELKKFKK